MMAWGNFFSLPCPAKRWDNNYTSLMLGFLPLIGLVIGIIWSAIYFGLVYLGFPFFVVAFLITFLPFALCGFMHMDGFMDCCDAIMSRRPLEERQRILKDSNTGAFAVVSMIFLILGYFCFLSTAVTTGVDFANMIMIVVLSRAVSGLHVLICKPMGQSQYAQMQEETKALVNSEVLEAAESSEIVETAESFEESEEMANCETDEKAEEPAASIHDKARHHPALHPACDYFSAGIPVLKLPDCNCTGERIHCAWLPDCHSIREKKSRRHERRHCRLRYYLG